MAKTEALKTLLLKQKPTDEQRHAIFAREREFLLRASPGSGKTWTSCRRFIWRGAKWDHNVGGLALLSFTNAAIREFHDATASIGQRDLLSDPNYVGTFDSFVERFIVSPFGHLSTGRQTRPKLFLGPRPGDWNNKKLRAWTELSGGKKMPVPAWEIVPYLDNQTVAYRASQQFGGKSLQFSGGNPVVNLFKLGYYTHAQRVFLGCRILANRPHIAACLSRRFPEIVVDEAQDTNVWLVVLLNILRDFGTRVTLVGDPDQCIYEFAMADATSLPMLKKRWGISELPLSQSFRCNNAIAAAVRSIGGNAAFTGCGEPINEFAKPVIIREPDNSCASSVAEFERQLGRVGIAPSRSAILCRAHKQLEAISGETGYNKLKGITRDFGLAAFHRDVLRDFKHAYRLIVAILRGIADDSQFWEELEDNPESVTSLSIRRAIWTFTKSPDGLPSLNESADDWIDKLKRNLEQLLVQIGVANVPKMGHKIKRTGLNPGQLGLPLFQPQPLLPKIRRATIHQVKGESIDGVLMLGSTRFFNSVVSAINTNENTEDRRLAYVAMTRAKHSLVVSLPAPHFDRHGSDWQSWGFGVL